MSGSPSAGDKEEAVDLSAEDNDRGEDTDWMMDTQGTARGEEDSSQAREKEETRREGKEKVQEEDEPSPLGRTGFEPSSSQAEEELEPCQRVAKGWDRPIRLTTGASELRTEDGDSFRHTTCYKSWYTGDSPADYTWLYERPNYISTPSAIEGRNIIEMVEMSVGGVMKVIPAAKMVSPQRSMDREVAAVRLAANAFDITLKDVFQQERTAQALLVREI